MQKNTMFDPNMIASQQNIPIAPMVALECIDTHHIQDLFALMEQNRDTVQSWMPLLGDITTEQNLQSHITTCHQEAEQGTSFSYTLRVRGLLVGVFKIHWNATQNHKISYPRYAHFEYWIGERFRGYGIMIHTVLVATSHIFTTYGMDCIGITSNSKNTPPQQVAINAGYTYDKTIHHTKSTDKYILYCQLSPRHK